jgi:ABC-2 type transport system permease protein
LAFSGYSDWGVVVTNYLGILLTAIAYLSVGIFASSLTSNMIIAVITSFSILFGAILLAMSASIISNFMVAQMVGYLSFISHLQGFELGMIRSFDIFFYLSVTIFFSYLTVRSLDMRRF